MMIINLDSWNKRWILEKLLSFDSFQNFLKFFLRFTVYLCLQAFDDDVKWKTRRFREFTWRFECFRWDSSENLNPECVLDASSKFCKETENKSVLDPLLLHWSNSNFDFFVFSTVIVWICCFGGKFTLELQCFRFDDEDSVMNLWELLWIHLNFV